MTTAPTPSTERALFFEPMTTADLALVAATEQRANPHPWSIGHFSDSLAAGYPACMLTTPLLIGEAARPVRRIGWCCSAYSSGCGSVGTRAM